MRGEVQLRFVRLDERKTFARTQIAEERRLYPRSHTKTVEARGLLQELYAMLGKDGPICDKAPSLVIGIASRHDERASKLSMVIVGLRERSGLHS
jgi:hypothetical protein